MARHEALRWAWLDDLAVHHAHRSAPGGIAWALHNVEADVTPNIAQVTPKADLERGYETGKPLRRNRRLIPADTTLRFSAPKRAIAPGGNADQRLLRHAAASPSAPMLKRLTMEEGSGTMFSWPPGACPSCENGAKIAPFLAST